MIKQDLVQRIVERTGFPRTKAEAAVDAIFEGMKKALGKLGPYRAARVWRIHGEAAEDRSGRNPRTGAEVSISPGSAVRFKPGKELHLIG